MHLKMSSVKWQQFCLILNMLNSCQAFYLIILNQLYHCWYLHCYWKEAILITQGWMVNPEKLSSCSLNHINNHSYLQCTGCPQLRWTMCLAFLEVNWSRPKETWNYFTNNFSTDSLNSMDIYPFQFIKVVRKLSIQNFANEKCMWKKSSNSMSKNLRTTECFHCISLQCCHMSVMVSQITGNLTVGPTVCYTDIRGNLKALHHLSFMNSLVTKPNLVAKILATKFGFVPDWWRESTHHQWIPFINTSYANGQWCGKCFHFMSSHELWKWVGSWMCGCLVTWFCYQLIAKPGNKTAAPSCPYPNASETVSEISPGQKTEWRFFQNCWFIWVSYNLIN